MNTAVKEYIESGMDQIEGFFQEHAVTKVQILNDIQARHGIEGGVGEIGVHHGRFFILLALMKADWPHVAFDVFGEQLFNTDKSGHGDLDTFSANLKQYGLSERVEICSIDSLRIRDSLIEQLVQKHGELSMFSVDGSHTVEHTLNDMIVAEKLLGTGGLMIVDDYQNIAWPGVVEGVDRYFRDYAYRMLPLSVGFNKMILADYAYHPHYLNNMVEMTSDISNWRVKRVKRYGHPSLSLHLLG